MMKRCGTAGSRPRSTRLPISACTVAAFSVATLHDAERMLVAVHIDADRRHQGHVLVHVNAVDLDDHQPETGKIGRHPFLQPRCRQRNKTPRGGRFRQARAFGAGTSPSGKRIERWNLRVETLISIWFTAHLPSQSSVHRSSQLGRGCSLPSKPRSRGRSISTLPPWKPSLPFVLPQRCACRPLPRAWRGRRRPRIRLHHFGESLDPGGQAKSLEARRHARQRLDLQLSHRIAGGCDKSVHGVAFLSWNRHPKPTGSRRATPLHYFNNDRTSPEFILDDENHFLIRHVQSFS